MSKGNIAAVALTPASKKKFLKFLKEFLGKDSAAKVRHAVAVAGDGVAVVAERGPSVITDEIKRRLAIGSVFNAAIALNGAAILEVDQRVGGESTDGGVQASVMAEGDAWLNFKTKFDAVGGKGDFDKLMKAWSEHVLKIPVNLEYVGRNVHLRRESHLVFRDIHGTKIRVEDDYVWFRRKDSQPFGLENIDQLANVGHQHWEKVYLCPGHLIFDTLTDFYDEALGRESLSVEEGEELSKIGSMFLQRCHRDYDGFEFDAIEEGLDKWTSVLVDKKTLIPLHYSDIETVGLEQLGRRYRYTFDRKYFLGYLVAYFLLGKMRGKPELAAKKVLHEFKETVDHSSVSWGLGLKFLAGLLESELESDDLKNVFWSFLAECLSEEGDEIDAQLTFLYCLNEVKDWGSPSRLVDLLKIMRPRLSDSIQRYCSADNSGILRDVEGFFKRLAFEKVLNFFYLNPVSARFLLELYEETKASHSLFTANTFTAMIALARVMIGDMSFDVDLSSAELIVSMTDGAERGGLLEHERISSGSNRGSDLTCWLFVLGRFLAKREEAVRVVRESMSHEFSRVSEFQSQVDNELARFVTVSHYVPYVKMAYLVASAALAWLAYRSVFDFKNVVFEGGESVPFWQAYCAFMMFSMMCGFMSVYPGGGLGNALEGVVDLVSNIKPFDAPGLILALIRSGLTVPNKTLLDSINKVLKKINQSPLGQKRYDAMMVPVSQELILALKSTDLRIACQALQLLRGLPQMRSFPEDLDAAAQAILVNNQIFHHSDFIFSEIKLRCVTAAIEFVVEDALIRKETISTDVLKLLLHDYRDGFIRNKVLDVKRIVVVVGALFILFLFNSCKSAWVEIDGFFSASGYTLISILEMVISYCLLFFSLELLMHRCGCQEVALAKVAVSGLNRLRDKVPVSGRYQSIFKEAHRSHGSISIAKICESFNARKIDLGFLCQVISNRLRGAVRAILAEGRLKSTDRNRVLMDGFVVFNLIGDHWVMQLPYDDASVHPVLVSNPDYIAYLPAVSKGCSRVEVIKGCDKLYSIFHEVVVASLKGIFSDDAAEIAFRQLLDSSKDMFNLDNELSAHDIRSQVQRFLNTFRSGVRSDPSDALREMDSCFSSVLQKTFQFSRHGFMADNNERNEGGSDSSVLPARLT